jgi:hypothetical protein
MAVPRNIITPEMIVAAYRLDQNTDTPKRTIAAGLGIGGYCGDFHALISRGRA